MYLTRGKGLLFATAIIYQYRAAENPQGDLSREASFISIYGSLNRLHYYKSWTAHKFKCEGQDFSVLKHHTMNTGFAYLFMLLNK
jgi:hypothetical protein